MSHKAQTRVQEYKELMAVLRGCIARPSMYGYPEHVELISKHISHVCLSIIFNNWTFDLTEEMWRRIALNISSKPTFTEAVYEAKRYREKKWGESENDALNIVAGVFQSMWNEFENATSTFPYTRSWINSILLNRRLLGSPDAADSILFTLIMFMLENGDVQKDFRESYLKKCRIIKPSTSQGLKGVMAKPEWIPDVNKTSDTLHEYANLVSGLKNVLLYLEKLKAEHL